MAEKPNNSNRNRRNRSDQARVLTGQAALGMSGWNVIGSIFGGGRNKPRVRQKTNMEAPDMRRLKTPVVTVSRPAPPTPRPAPAARPAAPRPAANAVARPVPLPPRRPAAQTPPVAQTPSTLPAGGYSPRTMSGDGGTPQPRLDTNKGFEPNKTGFFDKLHRSLGGKGNATYKYSTGDNRSDKD